ncbi:hypothetical protein CDS26_15010 [Listeria monocytogenes]|nr:hypothetical protein [Listeria monocytogenes]
MKTLREIKKEKQSVMIILAELYEEHDLSFPDHKAGSKIGCPVCDQIVTCTSVIKRLESEIATYGKRQRSEPGSAKNKVLEENKILHSENMEDMERVLHWERVFTKRMYQDLTSAGWTSAEIRDNYDIPEFFFKRWKYKHELYVAVPLIYRVKTVDERIIFYKVFLEKDILFLTHLDNLLIDRYDRVEKENWTGIYFWHQGAYRTLHQVILNSEFGKIGETVVRLHNVQYCKRKEAEQVIFYDGDNKADIDAFCEPHEVVALKKKKKLHFSTNYGSVTLGPGEFLVRDMTNRFYRYTKDEFHQMYELTENKHDMGLISEATYHG